MRAREPIHPKSLYAERPPYNHDEYRRNVIRPQARKLQERGVYATPGDRSAGPRD